MRALYKLYKRYSELESSLQALEHRSPPDVSQNEFINRTKESIEIYRKKIGEVQKERNDTGSLEALYFPYSRILDATTLKKAVLLFDKTWFLDSLGKEAREIILGYTKYFPYQKLQDSWRALEDDYGLLFSSGQIELYDTTDIAKDFEPVIGANLLRDISNDDFLNHFPKNYPPHQIPSYDKWALLKEDFPWHSTRGVLGVEWEKFQYSGIKSIGLDQNLGVRIDYNLDVLPPQVKFIFVHPPQGLSIKLSQATIVSAYEDIPLFSDSAHHIDLLDQRLSETAFAGTDKKNTHAMSPQQMKARLGFAILDRFISDDALAQMSFKEILKLKDKYRDLKYRFSEKLSEVCYELENYQNAEKSGIQKVIDKHIVPQFRKLEDEMTNAFEDMVGRVIDNGAKALTGGISGSVLTGVVFSDASLSQLLAVGLGITSTTLLPLIPISVKYLLDQRKNKRNAFVYLLEAGKETQRRNRPV